MRRIAAKYLYTLTSTEPVRNGFVEVEDDGTVVRTGVCADPAAEPEFIDGAVAPGFVNAHCHVELSYLKGQFRKGTGMAGFIDQINEMRDNKSLQEKVDDLTREMDSMWEQGVVGMADISNCDDSFAVKARQPTSPTATTPSPSRPATRCTPAPSWRSSGPNRRIARP